MNWDDLKIVLTVSRCGSIAAAARQLDVDRTTVLRKLKLFQDQIDFQIFERRGSQYELTSGAEQVLETAMRVERDINGLEHSLEGRELKPQGLLRVTTTDSIFQSTLAPHLAGFRKVHPEISLEVDVSNFKLSLTKRDADIAVRPGKSVPAHLKGYYLGDIRFGVYAAKSWWKTNKSRNLEDQIWLGVDEPLLSAPPGQWMTRNVNESRIVMRTNSFVAQMSAVEAGMGIAILPDELGKTGKSLIRLGMDLSEIDNRLWILTHPGLVNSGRVKALLDYLLESVDLG